jgi:hypothetical protein
MDWIEVKKPRHELDYGIWVSCVAEIKHVESGEIVEYEHEMILKHGEEIPCLFNWEDGNYACDCNRFLFFNRAMGIEREEDWDVECTDGKFLVKLKNKKDGKVFYSEFE